VGVRLNCGGPNASGSDVDVDVGEELYVQRMSRKLKERGVTVSMKRREMGEKRWKSEAYLTYCTRMRRLDRDIRLKLEMGAMRERWLGKSPPNQPNQPPRPNLPKTPRHASIGRGTTAKWPRAISCLGEHRFAACNTPLAYCISSLCFEFAICHPITCLCLTSTVLIRRPCVFISAHSCSSCVRPIVLDDSE